MSAVTEALSAALVLVIPGVVAALGAWLVSWLRAHTTASAVRQAMDHHGDSALADQEAATELHRVPRLLRPRDVRKAIAKATERERAVRVSLAPQSPPSPTGVRPPDADDTEPGA